MGLIGVWTGFLDGMDFIHNSDSTVDEDGMHTWVEVGKVEAMVGIYVFHDLLQREGVGGGAYES